ncbi:hypothetical protein ACOMHN_061235 [Nucella lapillus]
MSKYRELELLKEQELTLLQLHMKFNDQLNRLKVEELAITNLLRLQKEREMKAQTGSTEEVGPAEEAIEQDTMEVLNLLVPDNPENKEAEEEEEEEEEEDDEEGRLISKEMGDLDDNSEEEGVEESHASYNAQLATYLEDLFQEQQENQHDHQLLGLSQNDGMEEEEEENGESAHELCTR